VIAVSADPNMFHLDIHAWIESQQTSHGVRHDDYAQYHGYCTRRLIRLSHEKEAKQYLVHSTKYASPLLASPIDADQDQNKTSRKKKSSGTRHAFSSRSHDTLALTTEDEEGNSVQVPVPHINILWYILVNAERSWAHSNKLQKSGTAKRQQVLKKLKRASEWAELLLEKAKLSADVSTIKECEAYHSWMSANLALERMKYQVHCTFLDAPVIFWHCPHMGLSVTNNCSLPTHFQEACQGYARAMTLCYDMSHEGVELDNQSDENDKLSRLVFNTCRYCVTSSLSILSIRTKASWRSYHGRTQIGTTS
jgi:hypothetical protein